MVRFHYPKAMDVTIESKWWQAIKMCSGSYVLISHIRDAVMSICIDSSLCTLLVDQTIKIMPGL